jgi:biopolymer transport protein ExbB
MKTLHTLRNVALTLLLLVPGMANAWWNDQWPYRLPIALDASATGANLQAGATDATVLVKLHTGNFEDFFSLKEDLADIRFVADDDKTPLKFHVEHADLVNQLVYIWVKVPQISGGVNTGRIWMYYGNETATPAQDAGGSFDANTALALHFGPELGKDASANANDAATVAAVAASGAQIANGAGFEAGKTILVNDTPSLAVSAAKGATISFWMKPAGLQTDALIFHRAGAGSEVAIGLDQNAIYARVKLPNGRVAETTKSASVRVDNWQHVALVIEATKLALYVDGAEVTNTPLQLADFGGAITLGAAVDGSRAYSGALDEVRIDSVARDADWIVLQAANQGLDKLLQVQKAEQLGDGGGHGSGFWKVIIGSQDEAGWAVLILLFIMAFICFGVMIGKGIYVGRVQKDNERFLEQYRELGDADPAMLDQEETEEDKQLEDSPIAQAMFGKHDHFQSSPIYRVYHRAVQETRARIGTGASRKAAGLTPAAIASIRATLDTQIVREMQRLNSQMVLLTIGVAGGPFIGLFGTVVGVMIVFAAIAASGDVNINAIAPGVAAALAATVMGLFVAIPALFGYNYLTSKIKAATADMRVFADEFTTRLAEYYGDK